MLRRLLALASVTLVVAAAAGCGNTDSWVDSAAAPGWSAQYADAANSSYTATMNGHVFKEGAPQNSLASFTIPSQIGVILDANSWYSYYHPGNGGTDAGNAATMQQNLSTSATAGDFTYVRRHNDGANCQFLDGHAKCQGCNSLVADRYFWGCSGI